MKQIYLSISVFLFVLISGTESKAQEFQNKSLRVPIVTIQKNKQSTQKKDESTTTVCKDNLGGALEPSFVKFKIKETSFDHVTYAAPTTYYHEYPISENTSTVLIVGQEYVFYTFTSSEAVLAIWIDYNQNNIFEAEEWTELVNNMQSENTSNFTISAHAIPGKTKMRVRTRAYGSAIKATDACSSFGSGETRDYTIEIKTASLSVGNITKEKKQLNIYPNPTSGYVKVEDNNEIENLLLYSDSGKLLISNAHNHLDLTGYATGLYIVKVQYKDGQSTFRKLIKK